MINEFSKDFNCIFLCPRLKKENYEFSYVDEICKRVLCNKLAVNPITYLIQASSSKQSSEKIPKEPILNNSALIIFFLIDLLCERGKIPNTTSDDLDFKVNFF
jgi:hypothetical protein